jgi:hypothetical protein
MSAARFSGPGGVRVARVLGIEQVLLEGGGRILRWLHTYDEGVPSPTKDDIGAILDGIDGSLNISHPIACEALVTAATSAGAEIRVVFATSTSTPRRSRS